MFPFEITESGPNDFTFAAKKSLIEQTPWSIHGTVRDVDGKPVRGECLGNLAAVHAKAGRYAEAVALANRIVDVGWRLNTYVAIVKALL